MFADSFCDSDWANRSHRAWTTLASFALQSLAVIGLLLLPLIYTQGLPRLALLVPRARACPTTGSPSRAAALQFTSAAQSNMIETRLLSPAQIPHDVSMLAETAPPPPVLDLNRFRC